MTDLFEDEYLTDSQQSDWDDEDLLDELPAPIAQSEAFEYIGNEEAVAHLNSLMASKKLPHALMICGEQGIGKYTLARALAHSLLTSQNQLIFEENSAALNRMDHGSHSDYLYLAAETNDQGKLKNISVDQIRKISGFLSKTPGEAPMHIIIIDGAESMNSNASNALLKNLEEPPANTLIILISHNQSGLLPTIKSRVQILKCSPLSHENCILIIKNLLQVDDFYDDEDIELITKLSDHRPGLAAKWLKSGAIDMYRRWLGIVESSGDDTAQLIAINQFVGEVLADKATMHQQIEILEMLILVFIKRAAVENSFVDQQEMTAIESYRSRVDPKSMIHHWFLIKDQFSLVQKLHLEYKNTLITILLRVLRGQPPLELL